MTLIVNVSTKPLPAPKLTVFPDPACTSLSQTVEFTGIVENATNTNVLWTLVSGGGSIDSTGIYTAPAATGSAMVRAVCEANTNIYQDIIVNIHSTPAGCCEDLPNIYPKKTTITPSATQQMILYINGIEVSPTGATWSVDSGPGSISASGLYTAPSSTTNSVGVAVVKAETTAECYDTSTILISHDSIDIEVLPKLITCYPGDEAVFDSTVFGTDDQTVTWTILGYPEQDTNPVTYLPVGATTSDVTVTAPSAMPSYPTFRVRATSAVDSNVWDEGVVVVVSGGLPLTKRHYTHYKLNESCDPAVSETEQTIESDPYKGYVGTIPVFIKQVDASIPGFGSYKKTIIEELEKEGWPDGLTSDTFVAMTAYESVATPPDSDVSFVKYNPNDETSTLGIPWNRTYKIPTWEKIYLTINSTGTITSPSAAFLQQDFSSLGTSIDVVTGTTGLEFISGLTEDSVTFVYSAAYGFFAGASGTAFNPTSTARDVVVFSAAINGVTFANTMYFRPEPDLPEVFPEILGPCNNEPYVYFPGESQLDFDTYVGDSNEGKSLNTPYSSYEAVSTYMSADAWSSLHQGCSEECQTPPNWVGQEYAQQVPFPLPCKVMRVVNGNLTDFGFRSSLWRYPTFMNHYHGRWSCFIPALATATVTLNESGGLSVADPLFHELKLSSIKNRYFTSYDPDLMGKVKYPVSCTFDVVGSTENTGFGPTYKYKPVTSTGSTFDSNEYTLLSDPLGYYAVFKSLLTSFVGKPRILYVKVTPNVFGGTFTKSVIVPIYMFGVVTNAEILNVRSDCQTTYTIKYSGLHLVDETNTLTTNIQRDVVFYAPAGRAGSSIPSMHVLSIPKTEVLSGTGEQGLEKYVSGGQVPVEGLATISTQAERQDEFWGGGVDNTWRAYSSYLLPAADQGFTSVMKLSLYGPPIRSGGSLSGGSVGGSRSGSRVV